VRSPLQAEVIAMVCSMFGGSSETCGSVTSGGTESILVAIKAYRDQAASRGITNPNLVLSRTAHPAFLKVCLLGFAFLSTISILVGLPVLQDPRLCSLVCSNYCVILWQPRIVQEDEKTRAVSARSMAKRIDGNTIALVGSCINVRAPHFCLAE
jgi:sphinganine-1-phosphate aldolase